MTASQVQFLTQEDLGKRVGVMVPKTEPYSDEWIMQSLTPQIGYLVKVKEQVDGKIHLALASDPERDYRRDPYWQVDYIVEPERECVVSSD